MSDPRIRSYHVGQINTQADGGFWMPARPDLDIPYSYNSQDLNFAFGLDLSKDSKIEFKGLRLSQKNLEFPGLYFDINKLTTDAYSLRYQLNNQDYFDRFTADVWYNRTGA